MTVNLPNIVNLLGYYFFISWFINTSTFAFHFKFIISSKFIKNCLSEQIKVSIIPIKFSS